MVLMVDMLTTLAGMAMPYRWSQTSRYPEHWTADDGDVFFKLARHHGVTPLLGHALQEERLVGVPESMAPRLLKDLHQNRLFHQAAHRRLTDIEQAMESEGISCVPLKGPCLAEEAYPATGLRPFEDLDLLVQPDHARGATAVLHKLGYTPLPGSLPSWVVRRFHFHSQWSHPQTRQCVELHWRPADRHILPGNEDVDFVAELSDNPAAMPVYLAVHLAKHGFASRRIIAREQGPLLALHPLADIRLVWLIDYLLLVSRRNLAPAEVAGVALRWQAESALEITSALAGAINAPLPCLHPAAANASWFAVKDRLLDRMTRDLASPARWPDTPWWLKAGKRTGFRPIRLLDMVSGT